MGKMSVYHVSYMPIKNPEIRKGRNTKDFGVGFYCTIIKEQAQRWARRYDTKVVSIYDVRINSNLNIKEFKEMTEEWLDFIMGRESKKDNDLFFTCGLIDYIARKTKNTRSYVVNQLGKKRLEKIYDLADVYHCDNIDRVTDDFIEESNIQNGTFDNVGDCGYSIPSYWDIGKVYKRLIKQVAQDKEIPIIDALIIVYNSFISPKIDDYNSSVYYENPSYIFESFKEGKLL